MEILAVLFGFTLAIWQGVAIIMALKESRSKTFWKSTEDLARSFYAHLIAVSDYHNPFAYWNHWLIALLLSLVEIPKMGFLKVLGIMGVLWHTHSLMKQSSLQENKVSPYDTLKWSRVP